MLLGEPQGAGVRYRPVNSCLLPLGELEGRHLVTIEGLNPPSAPGPAPALNPIQEGFVLEGATQCGFCTPGFIVALTGYFLGSESPDPESAEDAVAGKPVPLHALRLHPPGHRPAAGAAPGLALAAACSAWRWGIGAA